LYVFAPLYATLFDTRDTPGDTFLFGLLGSSKRLFDDFITSSVDVYCTAWRQMAIGLTGPNGQGRLGRLWGLEPDNIQRKALVFRAGSEASIRSAHDQPLR
jgi:hypothetical protein